MDKPQLIEKRRTRYKHSKQLKHFVSVMTTVAKTSQAYSEPCQTSKMERVAKIINRFSMFDRVLNTSVDLFHEKFGSMQVI